MSEELEKKFIEAQIRIDSYIDCICREAIKPSVYEHYEQLGCFVIDNSSTFYRNTDLFPSYYIRKAGIAPLINW